jgi:nucleoside-diphosphate-sugar epimerase
MTVPTILITGATGFIGGATAAQLLLRPEPCRVLLLVRAETPGQAEARAGKSLGRFAGADLLEPALRRCEVLRGDLTDPQALADPRLDDVTHVLHLAANTSFRSDPLMYPSYLYNTSFRSVRAVRHTNILGTLALAHRMRRAPGLVRFLYVGTAYVCGAEPPRVVREDDYPRPDVRHLVEYTSSKAECERLLERTAPELPLVVARPSAVVGHTRLGCRPSASIFWYYRAVDLLRRVPVPLDTRKDIVPVDYTADALLRLLLKPDLRHRRYHVSAGEAGAVSWREMAAAFAECNGARPENPYRVVDFPTLVRERGRLRELLGPGDEERLLQALELFFRFSACGAEAFDNRRLLEEGLPPPPRFTSYLRLCATQPPGRSVYEQMRDDD